jgi:hypothetical protein
MEHLPNLSTRMCRARRRLTLSSGIVFLGRRTIAKPQQLPFRRRIAAS